MKKIKILLLLILTPFLVSCTKVISNPDVQILNQKAVELMNSGDIDGAIARLESINDINPNFPQNHYNLGVAYYKNSEYEKAIESLKQSIALDKNFADAYYTTGLAYQDLAGKYIENLEKPDNKETAIDKENVDSKISEIQNLSKTEKLTKIIDNLKSSKDYYNQYVNLTNNSEEKERIIQESQNIDADIKKFEQKLSLAAKN